MFNGDVDELRTGRLLLRRWQPGDEAEMARINRAAEVGCYLNRPADDQAIAAFFGQITGHWAEYGFGPWALESTEPGLEGRFVGFTGLAHVPPCICR